MSDDLADELNLKMLHQVRTKWGLPTDPAVREAFQIVKRHDFVPVVWTEEGTTLRSAPLDRDRPSRELLEKVYVDEAIVVAARDQKVESTSSQPTIMAEMIELAGIGHGQRVLEIGTGSGYNAAVLATIVGDPEHVVTVDSNAAVIEMARSSLARVGLGAVRVHEGEGGFGFAGGAPYDAIIVACACTDVPAFWSEQLAPGGVIVLPLATRGVEAIARLCKQPDGTLAGTLHSYVTFMRMTGSPSMITHYHFDSHNFGALRSILDTSFPSEGTLSAEIKEHVKGRELLDLAQYMAVADERTVVFEDDRPEGLGTAYGLWGRLTAAKGFAFIVKGEVVSYGDDEVLDALEDLVHRFVELGKPGLPSYRVRVMPSSQLPPAGPHCYVVRRTHCHTAFTLVKS